MAADLKHLQPLDYHRKFVEHDIRSDGRQLTKFRPVSLNIGSISTSNGSSVVKLGNTLIICGIKAEVEISKANEENRGSIVINLNLPSLCSSRFRTGSNEQTQIINHSLKQIIADSNCVPLSSLAIPDSKYAWVLYCDLQCLDYDGGVVDASIIALLSALKIVSLPQIVVNQQTGEVKQKDDCKVPLQVVTHPVVSTFAIFDEDVIFSDPTGDEEDVVNSLFTISITDDENGHNFYKPGMNSITFEKLTSCMKLAKKRAIKIRRIVDQAVQSFNKSCKND